MIRLKILILELFSIYFVVIRHISCITEADLFPHEESTGSTRFKFDDDGQLTESLSSPFTLFNRTHSSIIISGNGAVAFGQNATGISNNPDCLLSDDGIKKIIPFWSDAIEGQESRLLYMETSSAPLLEKATKDISAAFPLLNRRQLNLSWMFIITWKDIFPYGSNATSLERNTFQLALTKSESHSFVLLYYSRIEWSLYGTWAAGFNFDNSHPRYRLPGSCTSGFSNLTQNGNFGIKGKWVFGVESNLRLPESHISIQPRVISVMGNVPVVIRGLHLAKEANSTITCVFHDLSRSQPSETSGIEVYNDSDEPIIVCPVPFIYSLGWMQLNLLFQQKLSLSPTTSIYKGHIYVVKEHDLGPLPQISVNMTQESPVLSASWNQSSVLMDEIETLDTSNNPTTVSPQTVQDSIEIVLLEYKRNSWKELGSVTSPIPNSGTYSSPLNMTILYQITKSSGRKPYLRNFALKYKYKLASGKKIQKLIPSDTLIATNTIVSAMQSSNPAPSKANVVGNVYDTVCKTWFEKEPDPPRSLDTLPCPRTVEQAQHDWRFSSENVAKSQLEILNPGASSSFIQKVPSASGAASQCAYDNHGNLLISIPGAGHLLRHSPNNRKDYWAHYTQDILPYLCCCRWGEFKESNCIQHYYSKRPSNVGRDYAAPQPARASGLAHISTFDATYYTLLGAGDFWFIKYSSSDSNDDSLPDHDHHTNEFNLQVRMEMFHVQHSNASSVITTAAMESISNDKEVKVEVYLTPSRILVMVNDQLVNGQGQEKFLNFDLYSDGLTISFQSENQVVLSFSSGYSILIMSPEGNDSSLIIIATAAPHIIGRTNGLLKKFGVSWLVNRNESMFTELSGKAYAVDNSNNPNFISATTGSYFMIETLPQIDDDEQYCNGFQECNYDYYSTNSSLLAKAGMKAHSVYEDVLRVANLVVGQCDLAESLENGYFNVSSLIAGSNMTVSCNSGYALQPEKIGETFTCQNWNSSSLREGATWLNTATNGSISSLTCVPENADVIEFVEYDFTTVTVTDEMIEMRSTVSDVLMKHGDYVDKESYEIWQEGKLFALLIYIIIAAVMVAVIVVVVSVTVIISKCSCCEKLRMYFIYSFCVVRRDDVELVEF